MDKHYQVKIQVSKTHRAITLLFKALSLIVYGIAFYIAWFYELQPVFWICLLMFFAQSLALAPSEYFKKLKEKEDKIISKVYQDIFGHIN